MERTSESSPSRREHQLSLLVLSLLVVIALVMLVMQARYDPAAWRRQAQRLGEKGVEPTAEPSAAPGVDAVAGLTALSDPESYQPHNLSDKINGKAELYLGAGFQSLQSRRFSLAGQPDQWMERYIYDMGQVRGAFAVFSVQRRSKIQPLTLTPHAYGASNGLFFVHGRYYVEIIAATVSDALQEKMEALARAFITSSPSDAEQLDELSRFPAEQLVPDSHALIADSAFGLDRMDWIFTARYSDEVSEATAFVSRRSSPQEAADLANAFHQYWMDYGGEELSPPPSLPSAKIVTILDSYEIVLVHGDILIGVHEATTLDFGQELAARIKRSIEESSP